MLDVKSQSMRPVHEVRKISQKKTGIDVEAKFYSLSKGGKGLDSKRNKYWPRMRLGLGYISI
jgi:hypothetical protein